ncbi:peptide-methionine (S)-S-oxide reductase MsrA [uncultured Roseivirga sp.]|uniref:peptide-methionine (S)-S-oxide reductase MsrA n=1 Tax=uncultured Roseivirga sp. TaxID=543088 RepID=UPI000D7A3C65|nr:peptide-methionine (S)-S-oxide reductase MsrA [uncultured Roseivirga sp.]PWL32333.1 MAG: peptide-methionine (S)-S-oxide reductase [Roseivirga sp. XM-24bin3]
MRDIYSILVSAMLLLSVSACYGQSEGSQLVDLNKAKGAGEEVATFAGGCFWCTEAVFERVKGVRDVVSGYTGGPEQSPTYYEVSYGETEHAEAVQIYYDPQVITYQELLDIFFVAHNPIQANGQGPDIGKQYRPVVYYHDAAQKSATENTIKKLDASGKYSKSIVTEVEAFEEFWLAEDYHQNYYELNPGNPYIIQVAVPKVKKFKKTFPEYVKAKYSGEN